VLLLETLTAILLFSIGVLGTVGLQAHTIRHINDAHYRGEAAHLAHSLIARMWAEDPRTLADRYDSTRGGDGYRQFVALALRLPGASLAGNAPGVQVTPGPSAGSQSVNVTLRWQIPGEPQSRRYSSATVIGRN
jgi:type IV pilus assembly protein PilV